jgi:hypothetical protein
MGCLHLGQEILIALVGSLEALILYFAPQERHVTLIFSAIYNTSQLSRRPKMAISLLIYVTVLFGWQLRGNLQCAAVISNRTGWFKPYP